MVTVLPSAEAAHEAACVNIGLVNSLCELAGLPNLTPRSAVEHYYRPRGGPGRDFWPQRPDGGANDAAAFSGVHQLQWELTVLVTTGKAPVALGLYEAQDQAAAEYSGEAPAIQAAAAAIEATRCPPED